MTEDSKFEKISGKLWTPVRTKPRQEKKLLTYCQAKGLVCYLPLLRKLHRYGKRKMEFFVPMFSGYVFCRLDDEDYKTLVLSHAVLFRVKMDEYEEDKLLRDLYAIRAFEDFSAQQEIIVKPELVAGTPVEVVSGPLRGVEGVVNKRTDNATLSVNIEILGQAVSVRIDASLLESC